MIHLFVYGTLLLSEIVLKITGKSFNSKPAVLEGYKRYGVKGCDYPAVIKKGGEKVPGLLLQNVDERSMQKIANFEGSEYEKRNVQVKVKAKKIKAVTFVWIGSIEQLDGNWNLEDFKRIVLRNYS